MSFVCSDILATGCNDKCVRVYYLATNIDKELKKFTGSSSTVICSTRVYVSIHLLLFVAFSRIAETL